MTPPLSRPLPASIGRYKIESLIGKGGMGEVYKAFDPSLDRTVALKTIAPDAENPEFLDRLYREARAVGRLHHPRIVTIYDLGEIGGVVFIAMEYLIGESLAGAIDRGDLLFEQKINILIQMLDALQYAHSEGVIHRDIKPSNVHLMPDRSAKLLDFGLARVARADSLTASGAVMGTPYYMSPEQLKGQRVDGRTDVYSTGVVAYELFTRRRAFDGEHITTVMLKVLSEPPAPMATAWSSTFPELERIITRAMAKSADDRYATAEDMRNALTAFLASSREAIVNAQAEITVYAQRAVIEAKTLIASGRVKESETLLAATLVANPDAKEVRQLLREATQALPKPTATPAPAPAAAPTATPSPAAPQAAAPPPAASPAAPPAREAAPAPRQTEAPRPPVSAQPQYPKVAPSPQAPRKAEERPARRMWWIGPAAAVIGVLIVALVMAQRGMAPSGGGAPTASAAGAASPPANTSSQPPANAGSQAASSGAAGSAAQTAAGGAPTSAGATTAPAGFGQAAPTAGQTTSTSSPSANRPAQATVGGQRGTTSSAGRDARSIYINAAGTDAVLRSQLTEAIKGRTLTVVAAPSAAHLEVSARTQVSVRPSPFNGNSALTADYVTTLQIRNLITGARQTVQLDGHALDFGEAVVRQAALRRAAEQMAETIEQETQK